MNEMNVSVEVVVESRHVFSVYDPENMTVLTLPVAATTERIRKPCGNVRRY